MKEYKTGWQKAEYVDMVYIKYEPNKNLPTIGAILPNHIENEVKALERAVCVTNEDNHKLNTLHKYILRR